MCTVAPVLRLMLLSSPLIICSAFAVFTLLWLPNVAIPVGVLICVAPICCGADTLPVVVSLPDVVSLPEVCHNSLHSAMRPNLHGS